MVMVCPCAGVAGSTETESATGSGVGVGVLVGVAVAVGDGVTVAVGEGVGVKVGVGDANKESTALLPLQPHNQIAIKVTTQYRTTVNVLLLSQTMLSLSSGEILRYCRKPAFRIYSGHEFANPTHCSVEFAPFNRYHRVDWVERFVGVGGGAPRA